MDSRRLDGPPSLAGMYIRVICAQCGGQGCRLCNEGYTWVSAYAQGRGEQGDTFVDLRGFAQLHVELHSEVRSREVFRESPPCESFSTFERWDGGGHG